MTAYLSIAKRNSDYFYRKMYAIRRGKQLRMMGILGHEKRPSGMRRNVDMINDFSLEQIGW